MEKRVILHFGAPKTGTTSLQHAFIRRREELRAEGILYPAVPRPNPKGKVRRAFEAGEDYGDAGDYYASHATLFWSYQPEFSPKHLRPRAEERLTELKAQWADILAGFRSGDARVMILSHEAGFMTPGTSDLGTLTAEFGGAETTLTFGLRPPEELFNGLYATYVSGMPRLDLPARRMPALWRYLDAGFEGMVTRLVGAVGAQRVLPFHARDLWTSPRSILGAFLSHVGIETGIEQDYHSRPTAGPVETLFLRRLNRRGMSRADFNIVATALLAGRPTERPPRRESFFPEAMQGEFNRRFAADVDWLHRSYGLPVPAEVTRPILPCRATNTRTEDAAVRDRLLPLLPTGTALRLGEIVRD